MSQTGSDYGPATGATEQGHLEETLRTNFFALHEAVFDSKIKLTLMPLQRMIEKMKKHKPVIDLSVDTNHRHEWLKAADVMYNFLRTLDHPLDTNIFELRKARQLMDCMELNANFDLNGKFDPDLKFKSSEQNPGPWIYSAEQRIAHYVKLIQDLNRLADE